MTANADVRDTNIRAHPRLVATPRQITRLKEPIRIEWLAGVDDWVRENAERWVELPPFTRLDKAEFGYCTYIGREHEMRVTALSIRWMQTGDERYRAAVIEHVRFMEEADPWSEVHRGARPFDPMATVDLNHGERALTLGLAYDWLYGSLDEEDKRLFHRVAKAYLFDPALEHCRDGGGCWWYAKPHNNWNGVCAGGLGVLCLAMYDDSESARRLLPRIEHSLGIFMNAHRDNSGASEEGTGYWNYGMRYAGLYFRSHETATGEPHPLLDQPWLEAHLTFPLDFSPNRLDASFGDIPGFGQPLPFHYDIARSRGLDRVVRRIDRRLRKNTRPVRSTNTGTGLNYWDAFEGATPLWLLLHDRVDTPEPDSESSVVRTYPGLDWALIADRMPDPNLYLSVRGGHAGAAHAHDDLLSFNACVGDEILVGNPKPSKYLPTTFTGRRAEIPDINPQFKNTLFINGCGIYHGTRTDSVAIVEAPGVKGVRMEATTAFTTPAGSPRAARNVSNLDFVGRLFLMLDNHCWLIIDRISSSKGAPALCEARYLSSAAVQTAQCSALITGARQAMRISFASNMPSAFLAAATTAPTTARDPAATMLRWCSDEFLEEIAPRTTVFAALLTPGDAEAAVSVALDGEAINVECRIDGGPVRIGLAADLGLR